MKALTFVLMMLLQASPTPSGVWSGAISLPGQELAVSPTLTHSGDTWAGTIDIPAQGAKGLPLGSIAVSGTAVTFAIDGVPGQPTFKGTLAPDGKTISGTFVQSAGSFPFKLSWKAESKAPEIVDGGKLEGIWEGTVPSGRRSIRLVFRITKAANGSITATFSSPDQGSPELPVTGIGFKNAAVHFDIPSIGGTYDGALTADGIAISGTFVQQGTSQELILKKTAEAAR